MRNILKNHGQNWNRSKGRCGTLNPTFTWTHYPWIIMTYHQHCATESVGVEAFCVTHVVHAGTWTKHFCVYLMGINCSMNSLLCPSFNRIHHSIWEEKPVRPEFHKVAFTVNVKNKIQNSWTLWWITNQAFYDRPLPLYNTIFGKGVVRIHKMGYGAKKKWTGNSCTPQEPTI